VGVEWLRIKYRNPIREFMFYDSHVSVVRTALMVIGGVIVIAAAAFAVSRRISHRKCDLDIVSDRAALRGFAVAMLLVFVFCWTLMCSDYDAMPFQAGVMSCLAVVGSVVAIRAKRKRWIIVYWLIWMFAGALCPAI
jgi:ABC-type xylose transport system permease subunit